MVRHSLFLSLLRKIESLHGSSSLLIVFKARTAHIIIQSEKGMVIIMKRRRRTILIMGSIALIAAFGYVLFFYANHSENSTDDNLKIEARGLESITLVNNGQAKAITEIDDTKAICDVINATDIAPTKTWNTMLVRIGGPSYLFMFNYLTGTKKEIGYYDGSYLIVDGIAYGINSTELEKFWLLDYTTHRWNYTDNMFETID